MWDSLGSTVFLAGRQRQMEELESDFDTKEDDDNDEDDD